MICWKRQRECLQMFKQTSGMWRKSSLDLMSGVSPFSTLTVMPTLAYASQNSWHPWSDTSLLVGILFRWSMACLQCIASEFITGNSEKIHGNFAVLSDLCLDLKLLLLEFWLFQISIKICGSVEIQDLTVIIKTLWFIKYA